MVRFRLEVAFIGGGLGADPAGLPRLRGWSEDTEPIFVHLLLSMGDAGSDSKRESDGTVAHFYGCDFWCVYVIP